MDAMQDKTMEQLKEELLALRKEQFNLRMQSKMGQVRDTSLQRKVRRNIARVKTVITQKGVAV
jgi:large subunit ribosomal protein L29